MNFIQEQPEVNKNTAVLCYTHSLIEANFALLIRISAEGQIININTSVDKNQARKLAGV